ncbi:MAG: GH92 family glycosyl hydrolase [Bacteroidales bacterium]|nr:GH92 family glycosyl hydrolase [Bacteroidales bacterium]
MEKFRKRSNLIMALAVAAIAVTSCQHSASPAKEPVDYVNPYIGNISHLLVPTFPTVQLPNSLLRIYPQRGDYTSEYVKGLPIIVTHHRERSAFNLTPVRSLPIEAKAYNYDNEVVRPYYYRTDLDDNQISAEFAPSHQSAIYSIDFCPGDDAIIAINTKGSAQCQGNMVTATQDLGNNTRIYLYMESENEPVESGAVENGNINPQKGDAQGEQACVAMRFAPGTEKVNLRYGVSLISTEQAKKNLEREIPTYDLKAVADAGREEWNQALSHIQVEGNDEDAKTMLYTSYYRTFERPICISEDGCYFSAFDGTVHDDGGKPFYTDDWIWDTYRAAHPLRLLTEPEKEEHIINSYLEMADQMGNGWMPTFPEITGDSRRMNSNHAVATVADAMAKGLNIDTLRAYEACRKAITEKTLAPWSSTPSGYIDEYYKEHGYIPALQEGEPETDPNVNAFEKRQPIAVTLGTSYDDWCLSRLAAALGKTDDADYFFQCGCNYRNVFNPDTEFFHPKDKNGNWIEPFDYRYSGGMGAREYYGENNGWVYRWDVPHNVADLIKLMGGPEKFVANLDQTFSEPLGKSKYAFYSQLPDHTGNVGQFSMANEPSLHVPYLYNYAGKPWKTQKRIRQMLDTWFRNDLMGIPGDEDGGGMSAFVVLSQLGFYPVTPGMTAYNIGSPMFEDTKIKLPGGKVFEIRAHNASKENKYIQSATLNGEEWTKPWFDHNDIKDGGLLTLEMGRKPNPKWGASLNDAPPSAGIIR